METLVFGSVILLRLDEAEFGGYLDFKSCDADHHKEFTPEMAGEYSGITFVLHGIGGD